MKTDVHRHDGSRFVFTQHDYLQSFAKKSLPQKALFRADEVALTFGIRPTLYNRYSEGWIDGHKYSSMYLRFPRDVD